MKIVSVVVNNPNLIELQYNSIKKYFRTDQHFELIIFNDAKDWPDVTNFNDITIKSQIVEIKYNMREHSQFASYKTNTCIGKTWRLCKFYNKIYVGQPRYLFYVGL